MSMEAKELMIGDWVSSPYGNIQVEFVYNNGYDDVVGEHEEMYLDCYTGEEDPRMKDITIEMVEPILLTEEMLLKNGFKWYDTSTMLGKERYLIFKMKTSTIFLRRQWKWIFRWEYAGESVCKNIRYVHEIQHLLRLCVCNELADKFKIE